MNNNKKIIIAVGIFFFIILLSLSIINIAINFMYPGNELAESIKENFKDSFGKSIKFDSLIFKYNGDIVLQNFYLSNTTDFNDNVNLIKCREVVIDTSLISLLSDKIIFSEVTMYKPEINIIKNYGKSYYDTFISDIFSGIKNDKISHFITRRFSIKLNNSKLFYKEVFKKSKTSVDFYDVDISVYYNGKRLEYNLDGKLVNNNLSGWMSSGFDAEGSVYFTESKSENKFKFKNIDFSIINNFLCENYKSPLFFSGNLSGNLRIIAGDGKIYIITGIDGDNLFVQNKDSNSGYIIKNEDIEIDLNLSALSSMEQIIINSLTFNNGIINISLKSDYLQNEYFAVALESNKIKLSDLSDVFTPLNNRTYNGELSFQGNIRYNLKEVKPDDIALEMKLQNLNVIPSENVKGDVPDIKNCNAIVTADKNRFLLKTKMETGNTDLDLSYTGIISEWNPFKSKNQLEIRSKNIDLPLIGDTVSAGINAIYNMAYVDMFQNFDEQKNFLKEPEGIFINNNDLRIKIIADKLLILHNAALENFNLELNLEKGSLKTEKFTLEGYEGIFNFNAYAALKQEYPFIKIEGGVKDLNLSQIAVNADSEIQAGGIMSSDFRFETNAFRVGQIVENGRAAINFSIKDGYISNTDKQKKISIFVKQNGYSESLPEPLTFNNLTFSFNQSSNEYYIRNFVMSGNKCNFSAYGKYIENEGLTIPVNLNINNGNSNIKVPLLIFGNLISPCIKINEKKSNDYMCF